MPLFVDHNWGHSSRYPGIVPPMAVVGGHDSDGSTIYVGRAMYQGDNLPAKVVPGRNEAYVSWGGNEIVIRNYEVLCGQNYKWIHCGHGQVPFNAVRTGTTTTGEPLYIGRGHWQGSLTVGKIHPSHNCLYIPYGGREHRLDSYEVLIFERGDTWNSVCGGQIPPGAVVGGHDSDGGTIFVGRSHHAGEYLPAKVIPNKRCAYVSYSGCEIIKDTYEVLTGHGYGWAHATHGNIPPNAVFAGSAHGERLYIGRGHWQNSLTVGKVHPTHGCLYIAYGGSEVRLDNYEVLVRQF